MMSSESTQSQAINPPPPTEVMASVPFSSSCFPTSSSSEYRSAVGADPLLLPSSFVRTPSYTDALFSFSEPQNDVDHPSTSGCASTSSYLEITVSDPKKENGASASLVPGSGSFFTYLITTRTCVGGGAVFSVRRRFRDVVTLADRLAESHRGYFIPLRPEKSVIGSQVMQKHDFIEHRREALEKYLWRLAAHPVIRRSEDLKIFLLGQGNLPFTLTTDTTSRMQEWSLSFPEQLSEDESNVRVAPKDAMFPASGGGDLLRMFKELKQSISNDLVGKKTLVTEDKTFLERKGRIQDFALHLNASWDRENNRYELERFERKKQIDFMCMLRGLALNQFCSVKLLEGDTIIMGSDGLFDNVFDHEIVTIISDSKDVAESAKRIADVASSHSLDVNFDSPYALEAINKGFDVPLWRKILGMKLTGGKPDDITVIVGHVLCS